MTFIQAILLGLLQGFTEFLPVSSSGHLALAQHLLGMRANTLSFDIMLHLGTLLAVVILFHKTLLHLIKAVFSAVLSRNFKQVPLIVWWLIIATIPAVIFGVLIKDTIETVFSSPQALGIGFLITSLLMFIASRIPDQNKDAEHISWLDSLIIGIMQAIAIIPSVSRSGATITGSLWRGLAREEAFSFSFLLAIPAILGAVLLDSKALLQTPAAELPFYLLGFMAAFFAGFGALLLFRKIVVTNKFLYFGLYCLLIGLFTLFIVK